MEKTTPMLAQYKKIKSEYPDCILFFRLGDFYEMFFEDARKASALLDLVLTSRGKTSAGKIPMCGIPYHAADSYIAKLIKSGIKVAICEQTEDPAQAKGIVKREVIRVISSGTFIDEQCTEARYLMALSFNKKSIGLAFTDTCSGSIRANQFSGTGPIAETIAKLPVYECIFPLEQKDKIKEIFSLPLLKNRQITLSPHDDWCFNPELARKSLCEHFSLNNLRGFGLDNLDQAAASSGALLEYMKLMNRRPMRHIDRISIYTDDKHVFISPAACYGLELDSLVSSMDNTLTAMGKRLLRYWIFHPLKNIKMINKRQQAITLLKQEQDKTDRLSLILKTMPDMEKSLSRISCGYGKARDLLALRICLLQIPELKQILIPLAEKNDLWSVPELPRLASLLEKAVNPEFPLARPEGKVIRNGFNAELDSWRDLQEHGNQGLKKLQKKYIEQTGINSLKIGFNKVFGYYIEISKANLHLAPEEFIRKQTLVNAERFITQELKEFEEKMLSAREKILALESELIKELCREILNNSRDLHSAAEGLARIDVLYSLTLVAGRKGYTAPQISDNTELIIKQGRHPVVEHFTPEPFIPNDNKLDCRDNHLLIITGPNMSGKSTYIRQTAILVIMAQIGAYLPADSAKIGIVDKIFTRIGAHDEISKGQSTFMVEMSETAGILHNLSARSLVILDEIGRGTSTYDGLSLAWAIAEHLSKHKVRTLFATHYHELTVLAEEFNGVKNYNVAVKEWNDRIVFLHQIIPGGTDDSYGIYVAQLAGIPAEIVNRSKAILTRLELQEDLREKIKTGNKNEEQISLFYQAKDPLQEKLKQEIKDLDLDRTSPLEALQKINQWKKWIEPDG